MCAMEEFIIIIGIPVNISLKCISPDVQLKIGIYAINDILKQIYYILSCEVTSRVSNFRIIKWAHLQT